MEHLEPKLIPARQMLRLEPRGKPLNDDQLLSELNLPTNGAQIYLKDLGPQIGWKTVGLKLKSVIIL